MLLLLKINNSRHAQTQTYRVQRGRSVSAMALGQLLLVLSGAHTRTR